MSQQPARLSLSLAELLDGLVCWVCDALWHACILVLHISEHEHVVQVAIYRGV